MKTTKVTNGYIYRGVHIQRDQEFTNGREWAYTFVMRDGYPNYELCTTLSGAKLEIDALIEQGNYTPVEGWLQHPTLVAVAQ